MLTPRDPLIPEVQSIDSVVEAFNSIDNGSGSLIVTEPKFNSNYALYYISSGTLI